MRWIALGGGIVLIFAAFASVVATLIVPGDTPARVARVVSQTFVPMFRACARLFRSYETKDRFLALQAPWFLLVFLGTWLALFICGYSLLLWSVTRIRLGSAFREAGSSLLTLGFATTHARAATAVDLAAAASGLVIVALLIGYLPALYGAFNRRERLVTLLEARAGAPAWGPEILWRHQRIGILDNMPAFYQRWEEWCADVAETHSTYPVLLWFRSPHPLRSWLTGLLAVLDSAALYLALSPDRAPSECRLCLRMGFTGLRTLADVLSIPYNPDPHPDDPIRLSYEEYLTAANRLYEIGFPVDRSPQDAWPDFCGWRVNYEEVALALADRIDATPGPWAGTRRMFGESVIMPRRPLDRTPTEPEGTDVTKGMQGRHSGSGKRTVMDATLPEGTRIGHVHLKVADIDRALSFYCGILGFRLVQRLGDQAAFVAAGDYHHHIGLNTWESKGGTPPPPGHTGLYHHAILFPTRKALGQALRRLIESNWPIGGASDHGVSEAIYLDDPDGNGIELYWDRPKEAWPRTEGGDIRMGTDPLDLEGLLAEADA